MKERPIILDSDSVRLILLGKKTHLSAPVRFVSLTEHPLEENAIVITLKNGNQAWLNSQKDHPYHITKFSPFGCVGDILWVREAWYPAFSRVESDNGCVYKADYGVRSDLANGWVPCSSRKGGGWMSPVAMPRWASRLTLRISDVQVKRLDSLTIEEIRSEGIEVDLPGSLSKHGEDLTAYREEMSRQFFKAHPPSTPSDLENPWIWMVRFSVKRNSRRRTP